MSVNPAIRQTFTLRNEQPHSGFLKQPEQSTAEKEIGSNTATFLFQYCYISPIRMGANGTTETFLQQKPRSVQVPSKLETLSCDEEGVADAQSNAFAQASYGLL